MHYRPLFLVCLVAVAACGSGPPAAPIPDGLTRSPVNTAERIIAYTVRDAAPLESKPPQHGMAAATELHQAPVAHARTESACQDHVERKASHIAKIRHASITFELNELLEIRPRSMVFSIPCTPGSDDCRPSETLERVLLRAAARSPRVEIRGRTDATTANASDQVIAARRAQQAQRLLVSNGISETIIHLSALATGGHIADNSTAQGQASNRRVEIEVMDIDPATQNDIESGDPHERDRTE